MRVSAATTAQLQAAFPGATVSGSTVTLNADIGPCVLTNTWGSVTVNLNGHSITSGVASTPAIRIDSVAKPTASTVLRLNLTGTGRVIGGAGQDAADGKIYGGTGGYGIHLPNQLYNVVTYENELPVTVTIGAGVTVLGGTGGAGLGPDGVGGTGGTAIYATTTAYRSKRVIMNNGTIKGGRGGVGVATGGAGGPALSLSYANYGWCTCTNNCVASGGDGGDAGLTPGAGGAAPSATIVAGPGSRTAGAAGTVLHDLCLASQFPGATVAGDATAGFTVTLASDVGPVTLPDCLGAVTVDLNGHSITGGAVSVKHAITFKKSAAAVTTPTALTLTGTGAVTGTAGSPGGCGIYTPALAAVVDVAVGANVTIRGGDGSDGLYGIGYAGGAGVSSAGYMNLTNAGAIQGGNGGNGYSMGGAGGAGVTLGAGRTCVNGGRILGGRGGDGGGGGTYYGAAGAAVATGALSGDGATVDGTAGVYDPYLYLEHFFADATVARVADGGCVVTFAADRGPLMLRDDLGAVEIRLNGFTIAGRDAPLTAEQGAAITFSKVSGNTTPTALTLTGWGYVKGGAGFDSSDPLVTGGLGGYAVYAPAGVNVRPITLQGADVQGGDGGYGPNGGGAGGVAFAGVAYTGSGRVVDGARGGNGAYENFLQAFAGQAITPVAGGGYVVTLNSDIEGLVLSDAIGSLTINLNGHAILGTPGTEDATDGGDALTIVGANQGASFALGLVGPGTVMGGTGVCAEGSDSPGFGGDGIVVLGSSTVLDLQVGAGVLVAGGDSAKGETWSGDGGDGVWATCGAVVTIVNDGTIRGGSAADAWPDPGTGGYAVNGGDALPTLTGSGTATDGVDGELDPAGVFDAAFGDLPVEKDEAGGFRIVLTNDLAALTLPENLGRLTIELNGHSITGAVGTAEEPTGGDAITVVYEWGEGFGPLDLTLVGPGTVAGGDGLMGGNVDEPGLGGRGICVDGCTETSIRVGAEVTIAGGKGGDAIGRVNIESNDGGEAISVDAERFFLDNAGTIRGGKGGDYVGTAKEWREGREYRTPTGGDGGSAVCIVSGEAGLRNVGEISGGAGGFGTAQSGYGSYALRVVGSATVGATNLVDGVLAGGNGGPGGDNGGGGANAVTAFDGGSLDLWNDGFVTGGDGGMAWPTPGYGEEWMWGNVTCAGDGVEEDGEPGLHDTLTPLHSAFPGARIRLAADGQGYVVKLLGDCGPVTLPDNMGAFTLDLNGFSITGSVTYVYAENGNLLTADSYRPDRTYYDYQAAFTFEPGVGDGVGATAVNVVGPGEIRGPDGAQSLDLDKDAEDGQPAVRVPDDCQTVSLTLGDGVTVRGGNGGNALDPDRVGVGAVGVEGDCVVSGSGTVLRGENGGFNVSGVLRAAFPSATVEPDGAGWRVTLAKYSDPVTLGDNLGLVTIDLNGKVISSRDGSALADARPAILIEHAEGAGQGPTHLVFTGGGRVQGGNGSDATAQTAPTSGGAAVGAGAGVRAGVVVTAEAGVTLRGGDGGRRTDPGPVALGGKAVDIVLAREGAGTFIDGATGECDATETVAACFPASASVVHVAGGGHRVTLSENVAGLVLPDNLGAVTLDLNGHSILGAPGAAGVDGGAAITFHATGVAQLGPTELTLVGPGLVAGGDGVDGSSSSLPTSGGSAVCADSDDVAAVCVTAGADVTLRGGRGGDGTRPGEVGLGGKAVAAPVVALGGGTRIDGADGLCDMMDALAAAFGPTATIARQDDGGYRVTLAEDLFDIVLPENYGRITVDLNGFSIRGSDATVADPAGDAIWVARAGVNNMPLALTFVGPGSVIGGTGSEVNIDGGGAIHAEASVDSFAVDVGEGVTVQGGKGWGASDEAGTTTSGDGGAAIYCDDYLSGTLRINNAGLIAGGDGGDYQGVDPYGDGGDGYYAIYVEGDSSLSAKGYAQAFCLTNAATGVIRGGNGGRGNDDAGDGYHGFYVEYFERGTIVNEGVIYGGCGGEEADYGGEGGYAVYLYGFTDLVIENRGLLHGGDGSDGISYGDSGDSALYVDSVGTATIRNDGAIRGGNGGMGSVYGYEAYDGIRLQNISDLVFVNAAEITGGSAGAGGEDGGDAYSACLFTNVVTLAVFENTGTITGGDGGDGGRTGGTVRPAVQITAESTGTYEVGTGTITDGHPGRVDLTALLRRIFDGLATVARDGTGYRVTLTNDVAGTVSLPPHLGELTIDLNGHDVRGIDAATAGDAATSAFAFTLSANDAPFVLNLVGSGTVVGGCGRAGEDGSDGASAIEVDGAGVLSVVVGEGVTVRGGRGADAPMIPGKGAPAIGVGASVTLEGRTGAGVVVAGADGQRDLGQLFAAICPEAEVSCVDGVWTLRLTNDVTELVLPENCGNVTLDLNGHAVRGAAATLSKPAGDALSIQHAEQAGGRLVLSIVGPGALIGGNGFDASVAYSPHVDGGAGIAVETGVAGVSIAFGADVTVKGGDGGDSGYGAAGEHGRGVDLPSGLEDVVVTGDGDVSDGRDGTYDNLRRATAMFGYLSDLPVTSDGQGGSVLTLTADLASLWVPDNMGPITVDLNGHSITAGSRANAITVSTTSIGSRPTELTLVGPGLVVGGSGKRYTGSSASSTTTGGGHAVYVNSKASLARLTVGEGVTLRGGEGGEFASTSTSSTTMYGGTGGAGLYFASCTNEFVLVNEGTIEGGRGGVFAGRGSNGIGGTGGYGLYAGDTSAGVMSVSNGVNGAISGGQGGTMSNFDSSYHGKKGGTGGNAVYMSGISTQRRSLVNDGLIRGGDGGNSEQTSGTSSTGANALNPSLSSSYGTYVNRGTITNGKAGAFSNMSTLRSVFGSAGSVTWDRTNGVGKVTLTSDRLGMSIPDGLGEVMIDLNGHTIKGSGTAAAITFTHPSSSVTTPTHLVLAGTGAVTGYDDPGSTTAAAGDGGVAFDLPAGTAAVRIEIGEDVIVRGGNGGDSTIEPGHGAPVVRMASGVNAVLTGETADGADGRLFGSAVEQYLLPIFPTADVVRNEDGGWTVTLTEDMGSVSLPDDLGPVTLDLNGFSVHGEDGATSGLSGAAIRINGTNLGENPTHLKIVGAGEIVGGRGAAVSEYSPTTGYAGGTGISIASSNIVLEIGADVTVRGGAGGNVSFNNTRVGGKGGSAVGVSSGAGDVTVLNAGRLVGGSGGENALDADDYMGTGGYGVYAGYATRFVLVNDGEIAGGAGGTGGAGVCTQNSVSRNTSNVVVADQPGMCVTNNVGGVIRGGAGGQPGDAGGIAVDMYAADQTFVNLGVVVGGRGADANDDHPKGGEGGMGVRVGNNGYASSRFVNEGTVTGGDGGFGLLSGGPGGKASNQMSSNVFCSLSGDGELLAGSLGGSRVSDVLVFQLPGVEATVDGNMLVLSLTNDLHGTFYVEPSLWGVTGAIEIDLNGHSIYGADGTAEHPDGWPAILVADDTYDYNGYGGLTIYDGTFSSNAVIRGGAGYPSSTSEPGGNGGAGIVGETVAMDNEIAHYIHDVQVIGGRGGDNTGTGDGGAGGNAVAGKLWWLDAVVFRGGDGGDAVTGDGGPGGDAWWGFNNGSDIGGDIWLYGGNGGSSRSGNGGNGGTGHHADPLVETYYFTDGIHYYGGAGGSSQDGDGGDGGHGLWGFAGEWNGGAWLYGGDGGTSVNGDGGNGGNGILGNAEYVASGYSSESVGGDGGASENGMGGNGGNGVVYVCADGRDENEGFWVGGDFELVGGAGADGLFRGLGGSAQIYGDDPNQGGLELNGTGKNDANGEDGRGRNWEFGVVGPGILDWNDLIEDPWLANTYIGETNAYLSVSIDGGEPIQVRYNDTDGQFLPEQIVFGGETDTVHHVAVVFHTSSTRITSVRPRGAIDEFVWNPYSIDIKEPVTHPESEPFTLANLGTVPAAEAKGRTLLCDAGIATTANLDANGRQLDATVNPAPTDAATTGTMDYWYVAQNPRNPGDARDTLAMTAPTLSPCEPTRFTVGGIEGLSEFSWEMLLREGGGASLTNGSLALTVVKTLDGVKTTNTYAYTAADLENAWKGETFRFDGPTNAQYEVTFTYTNNSDGDGQALVDNIRWSPLGASLMIVDHDDPGDGFVYLAFQPQFNRGRLRNTSVAAWRQRRALQGLRAKRGASRLGMEQFAPEGVELSDRPAHTAATDRVWVKVPLSGLDQDRGYWRVAVEDPELSYQDTDGTLVDPPAIRSGAAEEDARSVNVFGILKVLSTTTNTLVAIPWTWYSAQERNAAHIPANKLVKPTNLTDGDMLYSHVEDGEGLGHYAAWILEDGRWTAINTVAQSADGIGSVMRVGDDTVSVPRGNGVWLVRQHPYDVVDGVKNPVPFWVYGQSVTNAVVTPILPGPGGSHSEASASVKAHSTILGNPYGEATRINELVFEGPILANGVQGDCIVVPTGTSAEKRLYRGLGPQPELWCWPKPEIVKGRPRTAYDYDVTVPAGHAFWYERRGTEGELKVIWPYRP